MGQLSDLPKGKIKCRLSTKKGSTIMTTKDQGEKIKLTFEVILNRAETFDEEDLKKEFGGDLLKLCQWLFDNEGCWWEKEMKLVKVEEKK